MSIVNQPFFKMICKRFLILVVLKVKCVFVNVSKSNVMPLTFKHLNLTIVPCFITKIAVYFYWMIIIRRHPFLSVFKDSLRSHYHLLSIRIQVNTEFSFKQSDQIWIIYHPHNTRAIAIAVPYINFSVIIFL